MTVAFFKLHVAGDDFLLVDRSRRGHEALAENAATLPHLATAMLDRRRGVGANALVAVGEPLDRHDGAIPLRIFGPDGTERDEGSDAFFCAARWTSDSGRAGGGRLRFSTASGVRALATLDSRSFAIELTEPVPYGDTETGRLDLLLDGIPAAAYVLRMEGGIWAATVGSTVEMNPRRLRAALASAVPEAVPVSVRTLSRDRLGFLAGETADRATAAAVALAASIRAGRSNQATVAEWRGRGAAVHFADFGPADRTTGTIAETGPGALIDRGRFYAERKSPGRILVAGIAEYVCEGNFDFFA